MSPSIGSSRPRLARWRAIPGPPRDRVKARLLRLYVALERRYSSLRPGRRRTAYETAVDAIVGGPPAARPGGTSRSAARQVRAFARWLRERFGGRFHEMRRAPLGPLRQDLLTVVGLGAETADAILLHAAGRPVFVIDRHARRVLGRHRLIDPSAASETIRAHVEAHLPSDRELFRHYHALLVAVGAAHCGTVPRCHRCPLRFDLRGQPPATAGGTAGARFPRGPRERVIPCARRGRT